MINLIKVIKSDETLKFAIILKSLPFRNR